MNEQYTHHFRVYYEDTDAGGVVYHANYLNFFERTRTEWLRSKGLEQHQMREQDNVLMAIRQMHIDYVKPAKLDDLLTVTCEPVKHSKVSMEVLQTMHVGDELKAKARVQIVSLNAEKFKPMRFPQHLYQQLTGDKL